MFSKSRRALLKGMGYSSALSLAGVSGLSLAQSNSQTLDADLANVDVHLLPTQHAKTKTLNLFNHTDTNVVIDGIDQLTQDGKSGLLAIKVNKPGQQAAHGSVTLAPGESQEFIVAATRRHYQGIQAHNELLPVTIFDSQAA